MAKRKRNMNITILGKNRTEEYIDVWCDLNLKEQIKNIEGVSSVIPDNFQDHFLVKWNRCYDLDDIITEMRAVAEEAAREEQVIDIESALEELSDRGFVESV